MSTGHSRRVLLAGLFLVALGGLLLHARVHPVFVPDPGDPAARLFRPAFLAATLLPMLDVLVVTALLGFRRTAALGYLLNGMIVIYGAVIMGHYSLETLAPKHLGAAEWMFRSTLPDIAIAGADFCLGRAVFESWLREA